MAHLSSVNAEIEPKMSQKQFLSLLTFFCSQCTQTFYFDMSHDISTKKMQNELLNSSFELNKCQKRAKNDPEALFFQFWPHLVHSAYKLSILICHKVYFIQKLKISSHMAHLSSVNAKNEPKMSQKQFLSLLTFFCSQCIQTINFGMSHDISIKKMKNELLNSSINVKNGPKMSQKHFFSLFAPFCS